MGDAPEQHAAEAEQEQKSGGSRLIFIILGFVILLGAIGAAAMFMLGKGDASEDLTITSTTIEPGYMYAFPTPFTGNLAAPDNEFIYSANVTLEIKPRGDATDAEALAEMGIETEEKKTKMPYIKRAISEELGSKTRFEITSTTGRERISGTIKNNLNMLLMKAQIQEVFLEVFVN